MTSMSLVSAKIESHRVHLGEDFLLERACACRPRCANSLARRLNWLPFLLLTRGLLKEQAAMAQAGFNVGGAVTGFWIGVLLDRRWRRAASLVMLPVILFLLAVSPARTRTIVRASVSTRRGDLGGTSDRVCGSHLLLLRRGAGNRSGCCPGRRPTRLAGRSAFCGVLPCGGPGSISSTSRCNSNRRRVRHLRRAPRVA
jgi:hypothetical protein